MQQYSKSRLLNNVNYLLSRHNLKISELETAIEVSPGYFSRLKKNENDSACPSLDVLTSIANQFHCSISFLIYYDFVGLNETELFLVDVLNKIITKTSEDNIVWERLSSTSFLNSSFPLIVKRTGVLNMVEKRFKSLFSGREENVSHLVFYTHFLDSILYLIPISYSNSEDDYELYSVKKEAAKKICSSTNDEKHAFTELLKDLYIAATESSKKIRIENDIKKELEDFLNEAD